MAEAQGQAGLPSPLVLARIRGLDIRTIDHDNGFALVLPDCKKTFYSFLFKVSFSNSTAIFPKVATPVR